MMKTETTQVTRGQIINQLLHMKHGELNVYNDVGLKAVKTEPELFAHFIAWNEKKSEVRDSKVAFPILALRGEKDDELYENAAAHLCKLSPRDFLRACYYHRELNTIQLGAAKWLKKATELYLREREKNRKWWDATALQHRKSLKALYALNHVKPNAYAQKILFQKVYPHNSVFEKVSQLKDMRPDEAAGTILNEKIPFLIAVGALGGIKDKTDIVLALIERMSGNELITNTQMLTRLKVFENQTLKAAYDKAIERMKTDKKVSTLKAGRAMESVKDKKAVKQLQNIQEDRLAKLGGIEGDWLVLGDKSGSMHSAIEVAKNVSALIAQQVKGDVHLIFFDTSPTYYNVTGKTLTEIQEMTRRITAAGGTSIGCGLDYLLSKNIIVNGIAICSDGGENRTPQFSTVYTNYVKKFTIEPTIYFLHTVGDHDYLSHSCSQYKIMIEKFELGDKVDYYSLPNIVSMLRVGRYTMIDNIMETPLLTFKNVFSQ